MDSLRATALSDADQELAYWRDWVTESASEMGMQRAIEYWSSAMLEGGTEDPQELLPKEFLEPLLMTGLAVFVQTLAEHDPNRATNDVET